MSEGTYVFLCFRYGDMSRPKLAAVYTDENAAYAWLAGIEAGYASGAVIMFDAASGVFDFDDEIKKQTEEATHE